MDSIVIDKTFLACMFCFPISDQVMVPQRTVSFNVVFCTFTHMSGCMHNYIKDKFPEERWENKTNKLMTPSCIRASVSLLKERILNFYVININFTWRNITRQNKSLNKNICWLLSIYIHFRYQHQWRPCGLCYQGCLKLLRECSSQVEHRWWQHQRQLKF